MMQMQVQVKMQSKVEKLEILNNIASAIIINRSSRNGSDLGVGKSREDKSMHAHERT